MFISRAALPLLLILVAGCERGSLPAEAMSAPAAATTAAASVAPPHRPPPTELAQAQATPAQATPAPGQGLADEKPAAKPVAVAQASRAPSQSPASAPAATASADEHAGHDHRADEEPPAPTRADASTGTGGAAEAVYTCPMHPNVTSGAPGRCPECGMNLVLRK